MSLEVSNGRRRLVWLLIILAALVSVLQFFRLVKLNRFLPLPLPDDYPLLLEDNDNRFPAPTFSACLLVMDDNHFLIEWLAYHYQKLPLRRLILASDPRSRTSPSPILERWKGLMDITEWHDGDFFSKYKVQNILKKFKSTNATERLTILHRYRQRYFYVGCMRQLQRENDTSWVAMLDTDEYVLPNPHWKRARSVLTSPTGSSSKGGKSSVTIAHELRRLGNYKTLRSPCIGFPRLTIGTKESQLTDHDEACQVASSSLGMNASNFLTLRWKWHGSILDRKANKGGKSLLDLSRVSPGSIIFPNTDVHRPIKTLCAPESMWVKNKDSPIVIHHYIGSFEQWMYRSDPRGTRTRSKFESFQSLNTGVTNAMQPWLGDFCLDVGYDRAKQLLAGVGELEPFSDSKNSTWDEELQGLVPMISGSEPVAIRLLSMNDSIIWKDEQTQSKTFSACLLVMDDNHFLIEWLAYHYQKLPLRRLILASDPRSRTSPSPILERWKGLMDITEWHDDDFFSKYKVQNILAQPKITNATQRLTILHRFRQRYFYTKCMQRLQRENDTSWVAMLDTDEYVLPNPDWKRARTLLAPIGSGSGSNMTIATVLRRLENHTTLRSPCIGIPRLTIGTKESQLTDHDKARQVASSSLGMNASNFLTLRWKWHGSILDRKANKGSKSLLDLSRVSPGSITFDDADVHRPIKTLCKSRSMWVKNKDSPIVIHHYIGSFEQWMYRSDPRGTRTRSKFEAFQRLNTRATNAIQPWLGDFCLDVGYDRAKQLLAGVGELESFFGSKNSTWDEELQGLVSSLRRKRTPVAIRPP